MPGIDVEGFRDALNFWHRIRITTARRRSIALAVTKRSRRH
jgi:hypothetical protein